MTVRFLADEDLDSDIIEGLRSREPAIDILNAKKTSLRGTKDPDLLEFAAQQERILISHDRRTMIHHFRDRLAVGKTAPYKAVTSAAVNATVEEITASSNEPLKYWSAPPIKLLS